MRALITLVLLFAPALGGASPISVGGTNLEVPAPNGYVAVTPEMTDLYELQKLFVAPTNEEFVTFIPEGIVPSVMRGEIPELPRRFSVQTAKSLVGTSISGSDFLKLKGIIRTQNDEILKKVESQVPGLMGQVNAGMSEKYDMDLALSLSQMVPLQIHDETERTLAYSAYVKYSLNDASGNPTSFIALVTATFVHVKGKVLFLYSYADESDLEWSRDMSKEWAAALVAANPGDVQSSIRESLPSAATGIDWGRVGAKAIGGAFLGLIIALIGWAVSRGKAR